jgi:hypothetical protein
MTETLEGLKKVLVELERRAQIMNNSKNPQVVEMQRIIYNEKRTTVLETAYYVLSKEEVEKLHEFNETLNFY